MRLYGAIDLQSDNSVLVILDEQDRAVYERRLPNELSAILPALACIRPCLKRWQWSRPTTGIGW